MQISFTTYTIHKMCLHQKTEEIARGDIGAAIFDLLSSVHSVTQWDVSIWFTWAKAWGVNHDWRLQETFLQNWMHAKGTYINRCWSYQSLRDLQVKHGNKDLKKKKKNLVWINICLWVYNIGKGCKRILSFNASERYLSPFWQH